MKALGIALLALLAAGLAGGCKNAHPVAKVTNEDARVSVFPHSKHESMDCIDCHGEVAKSTALGQAKLPGRAKCEECHDAKADDAPGRALRLYKDPVPADYQISFDHAGHLSRMAVKDAKGCATCHAVLPEPGLARSYSPSMQTCTACHHHNEQVAQAKCQPCHVSLRRYPLKPIQALAGFSHEGDFIRKHGTLAKNSAETCSQCHDQTYCAVCHANATVPMRAEIRFPEKVQSDFIHRGDYVSRHQIEAASDPASCRKCHGSFFCDSCHKEQNISPRSTNPRDPHPPGWATPGSGAFHGTAARQNIVACAGCHDQSGPSNICVACHASRGPGLANVGGNPHPPDFRSKHKRDEIGKNSMCRACHTNG